MGAHVRFCDSVHVILYCAVFDLCRYVICMSSYIFFDLTFIHIMNITYHLYIIYMTHDRLFNFCILISYISPPMFLPHLTPPDPDSARPPGRPGPSLRTQGPPLGRLCRIVQIDQEKVLSKTLSVAIGFFEVFGLRNEQQ